MTRWAGWGSLGGYDTRGESILNTDINTRRGNQRENRLRVKIQSYHSRILSRPTLHKKPSHGIPRSRKSQTLLHRALLQNLTPVKNYYQNLAAGADTGNHKSALVRLVALIVSAYAARMGT